MMPVSIDLIGMSQSATAVSGKQDFLLAIAPKGPFLRIFRDSSEETERDSCMLALERLRCPDESRDALMAYSTRKFSRDQERVGFIKEVISAAERAAGFRQREAYRKRGTLERMLFDRARYEEDFYHSGEKYLALLHDDESIARFTSKPFLKFLEDTDGSRGVIGTYIDVLFYHYSRGHQGTVVRMARQELLSAAEPLKALCVTGTEAVEAYLNVVTECNNSVSGGDGEYARLTSVGCFDMMGRIGKEGVRFDSWIANRPERYLPIYSRKYREFCTELFTSYAKGEGISVALEKLIRY